MDYPLPTLTAIGDGCLMDARMKLAMDILKSPNFINDMLLRQEDDNTALPPAMAALTLAEDLFYLAKVRCWVAPLETLGTKPSADEVDHVKRNAHAQVVGQMHANTVSQDNQPSVQTLHGGMRQ
jgi:hypothetical protein